jgi:hypothetical protein
LQFEIAIAAGHYCEWVHKTVDMSSEKETFESFFQTLRLECERGEPFYMNWTVPMDAPDLLYYQVKKNTPIIPNIYFLLPSRVKRAPVVLKLCNLLAFRVSPVAYSATIL